MLYLRRVSKDDSGNLMDVAVSYGLNDLVFDGGQYEFRRVKLTDAQGFFDVINDYWKDTLTPAQEDEIYRQYKIVYDNFEMGCERDRLCDLVVNACWTILATLDFEEMRKWLSRSNKYILPSSLRGAGTEVYNEGADKPSFILITADDGSVAYQNIETTYTRGDYLTLAVLVMQLKPLLPLISAYVSMFESKDEKIEHGMGILKRTQLMLVTESADTATGNFEYVHPAIEKMYLHISSLRRCAFDKPGSSASSDVTLNVGLDGLSTEEIDDWLFSVVMTTKLMLGEISQTDGNVNVISSVYKSVNASIQTLLKKGGYIASVDNLTYSDTASVYEMFSGKITVTDGDIAIASRYASDARRMIAKMLPGPIDETLLTLCMEHMKQRLANNPRLNSYHLTLTRIMCGKYISPKIVIKLKHESIVTCYVVTMYYLFKQGYGVLAILMMANPDNALENDNNFGRTRLHSKLPVEVLLQIDEVYPHKLRKGKKEESLALNDVEALFDYLNGKLFNVVADRALMDIVMNSEYPLTKVGSLYGVTPRVKTLIALLMIELGRR